MAKTKGKAGKRKGGKKGARRGVPRRMTNVPERASLSSKITILPTGAPSYIANQMYNALSTQLADHPRALNVAKAYQHYRLKQIRITYKFPYDTFAQGIGANASRPNFYYMIDKAGSIPLAVTLESLKFMGARPRQVDEKPVFIQWAPSVLTSDETTAGPLPAQYKVSPWLSTDVPNVAHYGAFWYIEQLFGALEYQVELEVQFEFKKPLWTGTESSVPSVGYRAAILNNSPDGIEGGGDEQVSPSML